MDGTFNVVPLPIISYLSGSISQTQPLPRIYCDSNIIISILHHRYDRVHTLDWGVPDEGQSTWNRVSVLQYEATI